MSITATDLSLPSDSSQLQSIVLELRDETVKMEDMARSYEEEIQRLRFENSCLKHQLYGRKSEKLSGLADDGAQPGLLFTIEREEAPPDQELLVELIKVPAHTRQKKKNKPRGLPEHLSRIEVIHDLGAEEKVCGCGSELSRIGEMVHEKLEMRPAYFWVERHIRPKYACKNCEGVDKGDDEATVKVAAAPLDLLPKSIATPSLLAYLLVGKFVDGLPFYRLEKQLLRLGVCVSRASMAIWAITVSQKCKGLLDLFKSHLLSGPLIQMDETPIQVLNELGRDASTKSYMWVMRGGSPGKPTILYHYSTSRGSQVAETLLKGYRGGVQTDGYSAYHFLDYREGVVHAGCWAHVRRKFVDILRPLNKLRRPLKELGKTGEALQIIKDLYAIEKKAREEELSPQLLYELRQKESRPIVEKFKGWLAENTLLVPPKSPLGKAIHYPLGQWPRLIQFLDHSIFTLDNNLAENAIRPFVVGRKNWLFSDQEYGAEANAALYSIVETAKANGLNPHHYLCYLFDKLPALISQTNGHYPKITCKVHDQKGLEELMPQNLTPQKLQEHQDQYMQPPEGTP